MEEFIYTPQIDESIIDEFYINKANTPYALPDYISLKIYKILDLVVKYRNGRAIDVLDDEVFLKVFKDLITANTIRLSDDYIRMFNRTCYDCMDVDYNIILQRQKLEISYLLNKSYVDDLTSLGLDRDTATSIIIARYSTASNINVNYKRVIKTIQKQVNNKNFLQEKFIIDILSKLNIDSIKSLFYVVMTTPKGNSLDQQSIASTIDLAILNIIERFLPPQDVYTVISYYYNMIKSSDKQPRFKLKSISVGDYPLINAAIDRIESETGEYIII